MPKQPSPVWQPMPLTAIATYQSDAEASLRSYFSLSNPNYAIRFTGYRASDVAQELNERLNETDMRSALAVMARIEAAFRIDYKLRARSKNSDPISIEFRRLFKKRKEQARLEDEIWEVWRSNVDPSTGALISALRGAFKFRHWLAHGRYWRIDKKYDFRSIYLLADTVLQGFPLCM